jgi:hypothetical protein
MKQTPILFSTPMVQAILEGRKAQTRRVIKPQPFLNKQYHYANGNREWMEWFSMRGSNNDTPESWIQFCPYGKVGDVLWVRESYCPNYFDDKTHGYKSDWNKVATEYIPEPKWKSSIHMPKAACRIWLKITNVRVERLQDISEEDAAAEGIEVLNIPAWKNYIDSFDYCEKAHESFKTLWKSNNSEESWNDNPWVWVIEFERINIDK